MATKKKAAKKAAKKVAPKAVAEPIEEVTPEVPAVLVKASPQEVMVISLANNPRYVYASLEGTKIAVEVPAWMSPRLIKKTIKVVKKIDSEHYELVKDGN
jgi:hypothetical protein